RQTGRRRNGPSVPVGAAATRCDGAGSSGVLSRRQRVNGAHSQSMSSDCRTARAFSSTPSPVTSTTRAARPATTTRCRSFVNKTRSSSAERRARTRSGALGRRRPCRTLLLGATGRPRATSRRTGTAFSPCLCLRWRPRATIAVARRCGKVCAVPLDRPASVSIILFGTYHEQRAGMTRAAMRTQPEAERRYPVRLRIAVLPEGFGRQLDIMHAWLDETCGAKGWATAPAGTTGVVNDALALYFE